MPVPLPKRNLRVLRVNIPKAEGFTFDDAGQLTIVYSNLTGEDESFDYDENGNRETSTSNGATVIGPYNRLLEDDDWTYTYDPEGNLTRKDSNADNSYVLYTWDHRNRLTEVERHDTQGVTDLAVEYLYNASDQRVVRWDFYYDDGEVEEAFNSYQTYNGRDLALEYDTEQGFTHRYLWAAEVDQLLSDEAGSQVSWAANDHLGSVRDIVNNAGTVVQHREFDSYGAIDQVYNGAGQPMGGGFLGYTNIGYAGYVWDRRADMYLSPTRSYDPDTGRFLAEDPVEDGSNWYAAFGNSAPNTTDPSGLTPPGNPLNNLISQASYGVGKALGSLQQLPHNLVNAGIQGYKQYQFNNRLLENYGKSVSLEGLEGGAGPFLGGRNDRDFLYGNLSRSEKLDRIYAAADRNERVVASLQAQGRIAGNPPGLDYLTTLAYQSEISAGNKEFRRQVHAEWASRQPSTWDRVKLWDNAAIARDASNLIESGSSVTGAVYGAVGNALGSLVGLTGIVDAAEGRDHYGNRLSTEDRVLRGAFGSVQLVGTAAGLRAPVTSAGSRAGQAVRSFSADVGAGIDSTLRTLSAAPRYSPASRFGGIRLSAGTPSPLAPRVHLGVSGRLESSFAQITRANLGGGTSVTSAARSYIRTLGLPGDDAGHAIGKLLGGPGTKRAKNLFPQSPNINRGAFNQFEQQLARRVQAGDSVFARVVPRYHGNSTRPFEILYQARVSGHTISRVFSNP